MIKVVWNIIKFIFGSVFKLFSPVKKLICKRRKNSLSDVAETLNDHFSTSIDMTAVQTVSITEPEFQPWDTWGTEEQSQHRLSRQTQQYANRQAKENVDSDDDVDFFGDMQPEFKKAAKIKLKRKVEEEINKSAISMRLAADTEVPLVGSELGSWEEAGNAWSEEMAEDLSWQAEEAIREKRRLERQERSLEQQRKKQEMKSNKRDSHLVAVKLS